MSNSGSMEVEKDQPGSAEVDKDESTMHLGDGGSLSGGARDETMHSGGADNGATQSG